MAGRKFQIWNGLFVHREKGLFLSVYVDDVKLPGKKQNLDPIWKILNKEVDLGEPTSFQRSCLLTTQTHCEICKDSVANNRTMFESRISAGGVEKLPFPQNLRISSWSYDMAGHAQKCVDDIVSWRTRQLSNSTKCLLHASMTTTSKKKKRNLLENCHMYALKLF